MYYSPPPNPQIIPSFSSLELTVSEIDWYKPHHHHLKCCKNLDIDKPKPHICRIFKIIEKQFDSLCLKVANFNVICLFIESFVQWTCKKEKKIDLWICGLPAPCKGGPPDMSQKQQMIIKYQDKRQENKESSIWSVKVQWIPKPHHLVSKVFLSLIITVYWVLGSKDTEWRIRI